MARQRALFNGYDASGGLGLFITDGTSAGSYEIDPAGDASTGLNPANFVAFGSIVLFEGRDANKNFTLWKTDGTAAGTMEIPVAGTTNLIPAGLTSYGTEILFNGQDASSHYNMFVTDGTSAGTAEVLVPTAAASGLNPRSFTVLGNLVYFAGVDAAGLTGLWQTDGTAAHTVEITVAGAASTGVAPLNLAVVNGTLLFSGNTDGAAHRVLWGYDPATQVAAIIPVADSNPYGFYPTNFALLGNELMFSANNSVGLTELYETDGTAAGTHALAVSGTYVPTGFGTGFTPGKITALDGLGYFSGKDAAGLSALWVTDGTGPGTHEIAVNGAASTGIAPSNIVAINGALVFTGKDAAGNYGLWTSDGTTAGTVELSVTGGKSTGTYAYATTAVPDLAAQSAYVIAGTVAGQAVTDAGQLAPFAAVTVANAGDTGAGTATVSLSGANGVLSNPGTGTIGAGGTSFTVSGSVAVIQAALDGLVFTPTAHEVTPGSTVTTGFSLTVADGTGTGSASDSTTSVVATALETEPAVAGTVAGQAVTDQQTAHPFAAVTIADPDYGAAESVTVVLTQGGVASDAGGSLSGGGLSKTGAGTYVLSAGSPAAVQAALQSLLFTPGTVAAGTPVTVGATLTVSDGIGAPVTDSTTSLVVSHASGGTATGDVHMLTFTGLRYDFQAVGSFVLARSTVAGNPFQVDVVTQPWNLQPNTSLVTQVAARIGADVVGVGLDGSITLDGAADTALDAAHGVQVLAGGSLTRTADGAIRLDWAGGETLTVSNKGFYLDLLATAGAGDGPGSMQGLLGTLASQATDLALPDGTVLAQPVPDAVMLGAFADAWSVQPGDGLLGGHAGGGASPGFLIADAPNEVLTGSLGQGGAAAGVTIEATLATLSGALIEAFAPMRDTIDVLGATGLSVTTGQGAVTLVDAGVTQWASFTLAGPPGTPTLAADGHGGTLIRFA